MTDPARFPYDLAFDRNLGLVTDWEQLALRAKRVAIAGMGGVGGSHLLALARLGIGSFTIADFDQFEFVNFNRQAGATVSTVGHYKSAVLEEMALAINPELHIRRFGAGVTQDTTDEFLHEADLFVDGLDFFALPMRRHVFARCAALGIPAVTAAPIGMGVAFITFQPTSMSFEQYFRLEGHPESEQYLRFVVGLTPQAFHRHYVADATRIDLAHRKGPSTVAACQLCAGVVAVAALKLLLRRGGVMPAPCNHQYDPYQARYRKTRLRFGNAGPLQRLKIAMGRRLYRKLASGFPAPAPATVARSPIEEILNLARWAPSGDNSQPWTFRIVGPETVSVQIQIELENPYEYRAGEPTWLAAGMLLESMRIAATGWQRRMAWEMASDGAPNTISVRFSPSDCSVDPLLSFLTMGAVDRRAYRPRSLSGAERTALEACLAGHLTVDWHEGLRSRWRIARASAIATGIRLRCPEAFIIHQKIIDWQHAQSPSGIPARATGLSRPALWLTHWAMRRWERANWLNRLDGTLGAAVQMDYLPGLRSAAYFVMRRLAGRAGEPTTTTELMEMGSRIQRFWLTATRLGLAVQPEAAIIAFAHYGEQRIPFSTVPGLSDRAEALAQYFREVIGAGAQEVVFIGRIGEPYPILPTFRSSRRPLAELMR